MSELLTDEELSAIAAMYAEIVCLRGALRRMTALARLFASAAYEGDEESSDQATSKIEAALKDAPQ